MAHARGVVEGFYGRPYTPAQRRSLLGQLAVLENPVYMYAPKNDRWHRDDWRAPYPEDAWKTVLDLLESGRRLGISVVFGVSPAGARPEDTGMLRSKLTRAVEAGASGVALLFDDQVETAGAELADLHLSVARKATERLGVPVTVCPAVYCTELVEMMDGAAYIRRMAEGLSPGWNLMWTGSQVVSRTLGPNDLSVPGLRGRPLVWDNLLADDYCLRRVYLGPLDGRIPPRNGYLLNPSSAFPAALHAVWRMAGACGVAPDWPVDLGRRLEGWRIMALFHHTPWELPPEGREMLDELAGSLRSGGPSPRWLEPALAALGELTDELPGLSGGFDLLPYAVDLRRMLSIASGAMSGRGPKDLAYLLEGRLPYEHPLAAALARMADEREGGGRKWK